MKRTIITIDEQKCTGCGACITGCPEGALQLVNGKAQLANESYCDGLGACIGTCPQGAITVEERDAATYNEATVIKNIARQGDDAVRTHLHHLKTHKQYDDLHIAEQYLKKHKSSSSSQVTSLPCGCPSSMNKDFRNNAHTPSPHTTCAAATIPSALRQWPIQLRLVDPHASFFENAHLCVTADCVPFTYGNFHEQFLRDKTLVMFCPKLDTTLDMYVEKLTAIIRDNAIQSISVVRMEVPCCRGTMMLVHNAVAQAGKKVDVREHVISIRGEISSSPQSHS